MRCSACRSARCDLLRASPTRGTGLQGISYDDYEKEVAKAAEIGLKAELLDRTLSLNLAAYHTDVEDMQIFNFLAGPFGLLRVVTNVDEATLQGVEGDLRWRANQYVNLFAGVGLLDSEIDKYAGRPYTAGNKVPYAPDYTATAGIDFIVPIGNSGVSLVARRSSLVARRTSRRELHRRDVVQRRAG